MIAYPPKTPHVWMTEDGPIHSHKIWQMIDHITWLAAREMSVEEIRQAMKSQFLIELDPQRMKYHLRKTAVRGWTAKTKHGTYGHRLFLQMMH